MPPGNRCRSLGVFRLAIFSIKLNLIFGVQTMLENCSATKRSFTKHTLIGVLIAAGIFGGQTVSAEGQTRSASARAPARFDGPWSVVIMTDSGECDRAY